MTNAAAVAYHALRLNAVHDAAQSQEAEQADETAQRSRQRHFGHAEVERRRERFVQQAPELDVIDEERIIRRIRD